MEQYTVTGMSCAACSARVEKAVSKVDGVSSCSVSLLTNSMGVEGNAREDEIIRAVQEAGYGASKKGGKSAQMMKTADAGEALQDKDTPQLKRRLLYSLGFLLVLMYLSMGHMMWNWPLPESEVFHQRVEKLLSWGAQYGYSGGYGSWGGLCIQHICAFCNDRCTGKRRYESGYVIYA